MNPKTLSPSPATPATGGATVLARLTFKDPDFQIERPSGSKAQLAELIAAYVEYEEYLVVEFLSDGSTRVVPVRE